MKHLLTSPINYSLGTLRNVEIKCEGAMSGDNTRHQNPLRKQNEDVLSGRNERNLQCPQIVFLND
jgi:hypothetical protein